MVKWLWKMEILIDEALSKKLCKTGGSRTYFTTFEKLEVAREPAIRGHRCLAFIWSR